MRLAFIPILLTATLPATLPAQYKVLQTSKVGGDGGFDYVYADSTARTLYIPRSGPSGRITTFNLDSLAPTGEIPGISAHGAAVSQGHGFGSSKPVAMWDAKSLAPIKTVDVQGGPDGIFESAGKVYVLSHGAPNVTVLDAKDGSIVTTIDLGGAPEQGVADGKGHLYIDLEDKGSIAVVDTATNKVTQTFDLQGKGGTCAGLAIDKKNGILFATCRSPQTMVILSAADGKILDTLPIGQGTDGAVFNPATMEAFSSEGGGTLTIVKENSPTSFTVEQTLPTAPRAPRQDPHPRHQNQPHPRHRRRVHSTPTHHPGRTARPRPDGPRHLQHHGDWQVTALGMRHRTTSGIVPESSWSTASTRSTQFAPPPGRESLRRTPPAPSLLQCLCRA